VKHEVADVFLLEPMRSMRRFAISFIMEAPMRRTSFESTTRRAAPGNSKPMAGKCFRAKKALVLDDGRPFPGAAHRESARAVGEDGVGDRALQPLIEEIRGGADLHRHHHRAVKEETPARD
jgi:hypothetical protein